MPKTLKSGRRSSASFCISANNEVFRTHPEASRSPGIVHFKGEQELASRTLKWSNARLTEVWNKLPHAKPVKRFMSRQAGIRRIWRTLQAQHSNQAIPEDKSSKQNGGRESKASKIVGLLMQSKGATLQSLIAATGWRPHSIRGFISTLAKKRNLVIESFTHKEDRIYRIRPSKSR